MKSIKAVLTQVPRLAAAGYEDAAIETVSKYKGIPCIITRNIRYLKKSSIKAVTPQEY